MARNLIYPKKKSKKKTGPGINTRNIKIYLMGNYTYKDQAELTIKQVHTLCEKHKNTISGFIMTHHHHNLWDVVERIASEEGLEFHGKLFYDEWDIDCIKSYFPSEKK